MKKTALIVSLTLLSALIYGGVSAKAPAAVTAAEAKAGAWYWGDNHMHTIYSDGSNTVEKMVDQAIVKGLDFITITDHNTMAQKGDVDRIDIPGFLAMTGNEVSTTWGHFVGYNITQHESFHTMATSQQAINAVVGQGGIVYIAHPFMPEGSEGPSWKDFTVTNFQGIEVWNNYGAYTYDHQYNIQAFGWWDELNRDGRHIYGTAQTDSHNYIPVGSCKIKAYMEELSPSAFYKALRTGTFFGSNGPEIAFSVADFMMGGDYSIARANAPVTISVGGSYTQNIIKAQLLLNGTAVKTWTPGEKTFNDMYTVNVSDGDFVRFTLETAQHGFAFSNPIWFVEETYDSAKVIAKIDEIPAVIAASDKAKIETARTAYDTLSSNEKNGVTNYAKLVAAEEALTWIATSPARIQAAISKINEIPAAVTLADKGKVEAAREAYDALSADEKTKVTNYTKLTAAEAVIESRGRLQTAIANIEEIPETLKLSDKPKVEAARAAYDALSSGEKSEFGAANYAKLVKAESAMKALEEAGPAPESGCGKAGAAALIAAGLALIGLLFKKRYV